MAARRDATARLCLGDCGIVGGVGASSRRGAPCSDGVSLVPTVPMSGAAGHWCVLLKLCVAKADGSRVALGFGGRGVGRGWDVVTEG